MHVLRAFFRDHRLFAALVLGAALLMKAVLPAGFMPVAGDRVLAIAICSDASGGAQVRQIVIPASGQSDDGKVEHGKAEPGKAGHGKGQENCAFTSLANAAVGGADPGLLLAALVFILLLGFAPVTAALRTAPARLRPPLRGPPVCA